MDKCGEEVWVVLKRLDKTDGVVALRKVSFPSAAQVNIITQILSDSFGLNSPDVALKMRNHHGRLIPMNSSIPANSRHTYVSRPSVSVYTPSSAIIHPKPRTVPMTVINRSMTSRLQAVDRRIQRLTDLLPQIKLRHDEKLMQEIECLRQKLKFLSRKMQLADSHSWKGVLIRAPLW